MSNACGKAHEHNETYIYHHSYSMQAPRGSFLAGIRGLPLVWRKLRAWPISLTTLLASSSSKCLRFWIWVKIEPEDIENKDFESQPDNTKHWEDMTEIAWKCCVRTSSQLLKHQVKARIILKELYQFQNVPAKCTMCNTCYLHSSNVYIPFSSFSYLS